MGIINVTPDSFSDGGRFLAQDAALAQANRLIEEGADILDVGAESTRPQAIPVDAQDELRRLVPVLEGLRECAVPVSVDTWKPEVMRVALAHGASMINDVNALQAPGAMEAIGASDCAICLMHKQGDPQAMQVDPRYDDVVREVRDFLAARIEACRRAGIAQARLSIDPGFGFGKTPAHNLELLRNLNVLRVLAVPVLVGLSRKGLFGRITGRSVGGRLSASVTGAVLAAQRGAAIVRVHDVAETRDALLVLRAIEHQDFPLHG